jgi:hypothetical protein
MDAKEMMNQSYIEHKVNSILEPMIIRMAFLKPDNPAEFMIRWLKKNYGDRPCENQKKRSELDFLRKQIAEYDNQHVEGNNSDTDTESNSEDYNSSEEEEFKKKKELLSTKGLV